MFIAVHFSIDPNFGKTFDFSFLRKAQFDFRQSIWHFYNQSQFFKLRLELYWDVKGAILENRILFFGNDFSRHYQFSIFCDNFGS